MSSYGERDFVQALVPILIGRLPDPFVATEVDMLRVLDAASQWAERLVHARASPEWACAVLDVDGPAWNDAPDDQ